MTQWSMPCLEAAEEEERGGAYIKRTVKGLKVDRAIEGEREDAEENIIGYSEGRYCILGETLDVAVGNCIDRVARLLQLPNAPAPGWQVEQLAKQHVLAQRAAAKARARGSGQRSKKKVKTAQSSAAAAAAAAAPAEPRSEAARSGHGVLSAAAAASSAGRTKNSSSSSKKGASVSENEERAAGAAAAAAGAAAREEQSEEERKEDLLRRSDAPAAAAAAPPPPPPPASAAAAEQATAAAAATGDKEGSGGMSRCSRGSGSNKRETMAKKKMNTGEASSNYFEGYPVQLLTPAAICFSLQETVFAMLAEVSERAMALHGADQLLVVGGVGCNMRLQQLLERMAAARGASLGGMDDRYCIDNGAMVAYVGCLMAQQRQFVDVKDALYSQRFRTDQVKVSWRRS
ncbi:UNVERIFIED_CONTAM: hypothetical protein H355_007799 [Colinus virginianus]|nr:hypothetical protein H355_007799 [Colinus virginianus]